MTLVRWAAACTLLGGLLRTDAARQPGGCWDPVARRAGQRYGHVPATQPPLLTGTNAEHSSSAPEWRHDAAHDASSFRCIPDPRPDQSPPLARDVREDRCRPQPTRWARFAQHMDY